MDANTVKSSHIYAGFFQRFLAIWVDFLIVFPLNFIILFSLGINPLEFLSYTSIEQIEQAQNSSSSLLQTGIGALIAMLYSIIFWVNYNGATPGKKLLGIKVVKDDGSSPSYPVAFIRYIGTFLSALSLLFFGLGYLWVIWDKKKQAWHDKLAGTVVVKTDKEPQTGLAIFLMLIAIFLLFAYMASALFKGFMLGFDDAKKKRSANQEYLQEQLEQNKAKDQEKILSYVPSACGLTVPVPKTTDVLDKKSRKWLFEEVALAPESFYVLDKDVYPVKEVQGVFIGYKDVSSRLGGQTFSVAYPGLNIYCVENTKSLSLEEYTSLALANKDFNVTTEKTTYWGEVELVPVWLEGKMKDGQQIKEPAYLSVSKDKTKLFYIRSWAVSDSDPIKATLEDDIDVIVRNLQYRETEVEQSVKGVWTGRPIRFNSNSVGANTGSETVHRK